MAGSMKDALQKSGLAPKDQPRQGQHGPSKQWRSELPEQDAAPYVPFEAPALTKPKEASAKDRAPGPAEPSSED